VLIVGLGAVIAGRSRVFERIAGNISSVSARGGFVNLSPERYFLWDEALAMTADHPVSGVGIGAYILELQNYLAADKGLHPVAIESYKRNDSAENLPLQIGAELGLAGLIAFFWLLAALVALTRRVLRRSLSGAIPGPADRLLYVGAAAGLLSFGLNALFHSYVGSFETVYAFWFLAAFLAAAEPPPAAPLSSKRRVSAIIAVGLVVFAGVFAWDSGHSLSPGHRWKEFAIPPEFGLYQAEKTADGRDFRWTRAYGAFPVPANTGRVFVPIHASHPDISSRPVDVEFTLVEGFFRAKVRLGGVRLRDDGWSTLEYPLPPSIGPDAFLLITVDRTWVPLKVTGAPDPRSLGAAVGTLAFLPR
jgi:hypothetical protein